MTKLLFFLKIYFQHTAKHFLGMFDSNSFGILGLFILPRFRWAWIPLAAQQFALIKAPLVAQLGCFENVGEIVLNITGVTGCWESRSRSWAWTSRQDWSPIALLFLELLRKPEMKSDFHENRQRCDYANGKLDETVFSWYQSTPRKMRKCNLLDNFAKICLTPIKMKHLWNVMLHKNWQCEKIFSKPRCQQTACCQALNFWHWPSIWNL